MYTHISIYVHMRINERKYNIDSHEKERREYRCNYDLELCVFFVNFHYSNSLDNIIII